MPELKNTSTPRGMVMGFTHQQLAVAFALVEDRFDWKAPINATVDADLLPTVMLAVEFFTATKVEIRQLLPSGKVLIHAAGYRAGPAGDH